jgi:hypothetical protein
MTQPELVNTCLACKVVRPARVGDWRRVDFGSGRFSAGPLCGQTCETAFMSWPREAQFKAIFGNAQRGEYLIKRVVLGEIVPDRPTTNVVHMRSFCDPVEFPCPHEADAKKRWSGGVYVCEDSVTSTIVLTETPWTPETSTVRS